MSAGRTVVVTWPEEGRSFRVTLAPSGNGWRARVERDGERWDVELEAGPDSGRVWIGDRPCRYDWEPRGEGRGRLTLGGWTHDLLVRSEAADRAARSGAGAAAKARAREVRSPMPGLVLAVEVAEGDRVEAGGGLVIVEAMKMENEITAPAAGVVRELAVRAGEAIDQGALLCRIEP